MLALYLKPLCTMHSKSSFNALIMPCNAPYNALHNLMNNCNHSKYIIPWFHRQGLNLVLE